MRNLGLIILPFVLFSFSYRLNKSQDVDNGANINSVVDIDTNDLKDIKELIIQVLDWSSSEESIDLLPAISDNKDSIYIGFDMDILQLNLDKLKQTDFFSDEFIDNYKQIILTLDKKLKNKEFELGDWLVGDLPVFRFANDARPWCLCQDTPSDPGFDLEIIDKNDKDVTLNFKWGPDSSWINFKLRVVRKNDK